MLRWLWIVKDGIRTVGTPFELYSSITTMGAFQSEVPYRKLGSHVRTDCKFPPPVSRLVQVNWTGAIPRPGPPPP